MKHLIALLLTASTAYAINPALPVVRLESGQIVERRQAIPTRYTSERGVTVNYDSAGFNVWYSDGWRQASVTTVTNVTTVDIPAPIQAVAAAYKQAMEGIYGEGAVTNTALTREAVAIDLSLRPPEEVSADTGIRLSTWFEILNIYWGKGEIWSFPYGQASYTNTTTEEVWEAVP